MPRARKTCSEPRCPNLQPCPEHAPKPWTGSTRRSELPPDWSRRRAFVLARDPLCRLATTCDGLALSTECHHALSRDDHRVESLAGVCANCHRAETQRQAREARAPAARY